MPSKKNLKNLKAISAYFSSEELAALDKLAQVWGTSRNGAIKEAIRAAIKTNWQKRDLFADYKNNTKTQEHEDEADTKAAAIGPKPERKRQRQEPTHSDYLGTYEQGQAEAADFFRSEKNNGRTLEEVREDNAVYFEERGEEWRRGFADQFRKLEAEAEQPEAEQTEALKEAAAIESRTQAAKTEKTEKPETTKPTDKHKKTTAREFREQGIKRGAKRNRNRALLSGEFLDEEAKAEAEAFREKAAKEAAELKAKTEAINRKIAACHSDYQAGKISAAEHDRRINELNAELDDLPF